MSTTAAVTVQVTREDTQTTTGQRVELTIGDYREGKTIPVGVTEETLAISADIGNAGFLYVKNHTDPDVDSGNYVDIGYATGVYPNRLYAGESGLIPLAIATANVYVVASDADTPFQYEITERT